MKSKYEDEYDLLIAKICDKQKQCITKNKIMFSDFLNEKEQNIVKKNIKLKNSFWYGEEERLDRKVLIFYPEKLNEEIARRNLDKIICAIRITLPKEMFRKI